MEYRVALSYAGEDRLFVEYVADILKKYIGKDSVFHYTSGPHQATINAFFDFINTSFANERADTRDIVRTVCFVRKFKFNRKLFIVTGQETELLDRESNPRGSNLDQCCTWQGLTNSRMANRLNIGTIFVTLPEHGLQDLEPWSVSFNKDCFGQKIIESDPVSDIDRSSAENVAEFILRDTLELKHSKHSCKVFTYEKNAIKFYSELMSDLRKNPFTRFGEETDQKYIKLFAKDLNVIFNEGVPLVWPSVRLRTDLTFTANTLLKDIGDARPGFGSLISDQVVPNTGDENERVVVSSALSEHHHCADPPYDSQACMIRSNLCFPEAGPRSKIMELQRKVGIVVGGGIAPGINAVIDGIVRRHEDYSINVKVIGFEYGLWGLSQNAIDISQYKRNLSSTRNLPDALKTADHVSRAGSVLGTFRLDREPEDEFKNRMDQILENLRGLDILYMIGGDGTMKAANLLAKLARKRSLSTSIIGIPKTTDNDILWVWQSFGFATAVEKAREIINCLSIEVQSNPRICILQLFGSVSGFVVSHAVLSSDSGQCDAALIPESKFTIKALVAKLRRKFVHDIEQPEQIPYGLVVMAETAIPEDADMYVTDACLSTPEREALNNYKSEPIYLDGQTSDELRSASLKLVVAGIKKELASHFKTVRIFTNEPRHILRATNPSFADIIMGQRLGTLAVDNAMAGYSNFMVSQWLTEYVLVPLPLVTLGRKRIPDSGIFWKSVLAKTEQGDLM